jgi:hypothetical protein
MLRHIGKNDVRIKEFGLPRSGTNYTRFLIEENYQAIIIVDKEGWKHGYISPQLPSNRKCVLVCKNPFSWLISAYNYYQTSRNECVSMNVRSVQQFIRSEFALYHLKILLSYKNPIQCWNNMNRHWMSISNTGRKLFIVKHEDLLIDAQSLLDIMANRFSLLKKRKTFKNTSQAFRPAADTPVRLANKKFKSDYYTHAQYMDKFSENDLEFIKKELDAEVIERLGYSKNFV